MKLSILFLLVFFLSFGLLPESLAQDAASAVAAPVVPVVEAAPVVEAPKVLEQPPEWLVKTLEHIYAIPVVGPVVAKAVQWLGVIAVILSSLVAFLMVSVRALIPVLNYARLASFAMALQKFEASKVMYYLKYFSLFNAKK